MVIFLNLNLSLSEASLLCMLEILQGLYSEDIVKLQG